MEALQALIDYEYSKSIQDSELNRERMLRIAALEGIRDEILSITLGAQRDVV